MAKVTTADEYIDRFPRWRDELTLLRRLLRAGPAGAMEERVKWGTPCYVLDGVNVVGLVAFKAYVGLWFHDGASLADADGVLVNAQPGKTKALRQWRFGEGDTIPQRRVKAYVAEAMALARAGEAGCAARARGAAEGKGADEEAGPDELPVELSEALAGDAAAREAFDALTPGRRRAYAAHVAGAKREATRVSRAAKALPLIRAGVGLHDRYR